MIRLFLVRFVLVGAVVFSQVGLFQRGTTTDDRSVRTEQATVLIAKERVDRTLDACNAFNESRATQITISEALIRSVTSSPMASESPQSRLILAALVQRANRAIESATQKKTCTVESLKLGALATVANGH